MYTLEEAIEKFYDSKKDYEKEIKKNYPNAKGIESEDRENLILVVRDLKEGDVDGAISHLQSCDTEVREVFVRMLKDDPNYDWNGNRL